MFCYKEANLYKIQRLKEMAFDDDSEAGDDNDDLQYLKSAVLEDTFP